MKQVWHKAKRTHHRLISLPTALIIVMVLVLGWASLFTLRRNNLNMLERSQAVIDADVIGDQKQIEAALQELQRYVAGHMNTSTAVQLPSSYQRDAAARQQKALRRFGNIELYNRANAECVDSGVNGILLAQCIDDHLSGAAGNLVDLPDPRLYRYSFAAPYFSFDLAGFVLLVFGVFAYAGVHQLAVFLVKKGHQK